MKNFRIAILGGSAQSVARWTRLVRESGMNVSFAYISDERATIGQIYDSYFVLEDFFVRKDAENILRRVKIACRPEALGSWSKEKEPTNGE